MTYSRTVRNNDPATAKDTMTIDDDWLPTVVFDDQDEQKLLFIVESLEERFELVLYVTDRKAVCDEIGKFLEKLQEYSFGE